MILGRDCAHATSPSLSTQAILAQGILSNEILSSTTMSDDNSTDGGGKPSMKSDFDPSGGARPFFQPDDFDIYINKVTEETYIFHGPALPHPVERLEYDPEDHSVAVITKDGQSFDLGAKIQWMIRPYFSKAKQVFIVQTKDGESIDGIDVPLVVKETE